MFEKYEHQRNNSGHDGNDGMMMMIIIIMIIMILQSLVTSDVHTWMASTNGWETLSSSNWLPIE